MSAIDLSKAHWSDICLGLDEAARCEDRQSTRWAVFTEAAKRLRATRAGVAFQSLLDQAYKTAELLESDAKIDVNFRAFLAEQMRKAIAFSETSTRAAPAPEELFHLADDLRTRGWHALEGHADHFPLIERLIREEAVRRTTALCSKDGGHAS